MRIFSTLFRAFILSLVLFFFASNLQVSAQTLHIQGNNWVTADGKRFIVKGVNVEAFRDYINGCGFVTDNLFVNDNINKMITTMKGVDPNGGINAVRLDFDWRYINQGTYQNLSKYLDIAQAFTKSGIYVMISDYSNAGQPLTSTALAMPTFKAIIDGFRARGMEPYLIINPFNEPANFPSWADWVTANKSVLDYLRKTAGYTGIIMLDTPEWASGTDAASYQQIMSYDAGLLGGTSNLGFSNHWYPNIPISGSGYLDKSVEAAKSFPIVIGEMGQINPGASGLVPQYVTDVLNMVLNQGIPNGHNGIFAWIWNWCDANTMTEPWDNYQNLNTYGNMYKSYWSSVPINSTPAPYVSPSPISPTPTPITSPTPVPTPVSTSYPGAKIGFRSASSATNGTGSTSLTLTKPSLTTADDVLVAQVVVRGAGNTTITPPTGWTLIRRDNTLLSIGSALFYKVATLNEPTSYTWNFNASQLASGGVSAYTNVNTGSPIDASSGNYNYESTIAIAPSVYANVVGDMLLFFDAVTVNTTVNQPAGMIERWDVANGDVSTGTTSEMAEQLLAVVGETGNLSGTHNSNGSSNIAQAILLKPAPLSGASPVPTPTVKPGDANGDGLVNEADYQILISFFKQTVTGGYSQGDFNADKRVDGIDYVIWLNNYGK